METYLKKQKLAHQILKSENEKLINRVEEVINQFNLIDELQNKLKNNMMIDENCFTLTKFAEYLTNNYTKYSGRGFTAHEGKEFAKNGKLPDKYGGHKLKIINHKSSGLKFIKIYRN